MTPISPYFHPTTVVLVDDDSHMLRSLILGLDLDMLPHRAFHDSQEGLDFINQDRYREKFVNRLTMSEEDAVVDSIYFDPRSVLSELKSPDRFHQISVLIVDYEMPGMKGLELCEKIQNPFIKKILLTGVADENIAVEAFNQGVINRYIRKHDPEFLTLLQEAILKAQQQYFQDLFQIPLQALSLRSESTALVEPTFVKDFYERVASHNIQEYYLVEGTGTFIMVGSDGKKYSLVTIDDGLVEVFLDSESMEKLSQEDEKALKERRLVSFFYNPFKAPFYESDSPKNFLRSPLLLEGQKKNYYMAFEEGLIQIGNNLISWNKVLDDKG